MPPFNNNKENNSTKIKFSETGLLSKLICDFLKEEKTLESFCNSFGNIQDFKKIMDVKATSYNYRNELTNALLEQNIDFPEKHQLINSLKKTNTFTVTTGHQLSLFGGAAYTIYKILSTIKLAEKLKANFPQSNFIPIFWLASEDHDFKEISSAYINENTINWEGDYRFEIGRIKSKDLSAIYPAFLKSFSELEKKSDVFSEIEKIWFRPEANETLSDSMRKFIYYSFSKYPLLVIDGNCKQLKKLIKPHFSREIKDQIGFKFISETNQKLKKLGYHNQVNPRDINLFYLSSKERLRITKIGENLFNFVGSNFTASQEEIIQLLNNEPEKFSPNAVLRPLYQEVALPNLAYIGGAGEIAYWLQLKSCFNEFNVPFPVVLLRNSILINNNKIERKLQKFALSFKDIFKDIDHLKTKIIEDQNNFSQNFDLIKKQIKKLYEDLEKDLILIENTLEAPVESALKKSIKQLENLQKKVIKAEKRKQSENMQTIDEIKKHFFPLGMLQERKINCTEILVKNGKEFIDLIYKNIDFPTKEINFIKIL